MSAPHWNLDTSLAVAAPMIEPVNAPIFEVNAPIFEAGANCISVYTDPAWRTSDGATGCGWIFQQKDGSTTQQDQSASTTHHHNR